MKAIWHAFSAYNMHLIKNGKYNTQNTTWKIWHEKYNTKIYNTKKYYTKNTTQKLCFL